MSRGDNQEKRDAGPGCETILGMDDWTGAPVFGTRSEGALWVVRPSAYGLLEEDGRIAVVRSRDGTFLPGGGVEAGETPEQAIVREGLEECGFVVRVGPWMTRAVQFAHSASEGAHFEKQSTFRECAREASDRTRWQTGHELLWVDAETAARTLTHASHGWAIGQWKRRARP